MPQWSERDIVRWSSSLRESHNQALAGVSSARKPRVVTLESLYDQLGSLPATREELLRIAIGCAENHFHRPAIVMAWAAVFDRLAEILEIDKFKRISGVRKKWKPIASRDELVEGHSEFQIIDALREAGMINKTQQKSLHTALHVRNRAAHAGGYSPSFNITLGYIEDALGMLLDLDHVP